MKLQYVALNSFLREKVADAAVYSRSVSIALGVALGRSVPLPSEAPANASSYFSQNLQVSVERAAAEFNENIVIDFDLAASVARSVWLVRLGLVHPTAMIELPNDDTPGDWLVALSGGGFTLSRDVYDFVNANRECVFVMANRIAATMAGGNEERR